MCRSLSQHKSRLVGLTTLALALVLTLMPLPRGVAQAQEEMAEAKATLRVVHAVPGVEAVDVLIDGQPVLKRLAYGSTSDYLPMSADNHRVQIVPTGQTANAAVLDDTIDAT